MEYNDCMYSDDEIDTVLHLEVCYTNREIIANAVGLRLSEVNDIIDKYGDKQ